MIYLFVWFTKIFHFYQWLFQCKGSCHIGSRKPKNRMVSALPMTWKRQQAEQISGSAVKNSFGLRLLFWAGGHISCIGNPEIFHC
jgi:hypothetical protein